MPVAAGFSWLFIAVVIQGVAEVVGLGIVILVITGGSGFFFAFDPHVEVCILGVVGAPIGLGFCIGKKECNGEGKGAHMSLFNI